MVNWKKVGLLLGTGLAVIGIPYMIGNCHGRRAATESFTKSASQGREFGMEELRKAHSSDSNRTMLYVRGLEGRVDFDIRDDRGGMRDFYISTFKKHGKTNEEIFEIFCLADLMDDAKDYMIGPENLQKFVEEDDRRLTERYSGRYPFLKD